MRISTPFGPRPWPPRSLPSKRSSGPSWANGPCRPDVGRDGSTQLPLDADRPLRVFQLGHGGIAPRPRTAMTARQLVVLGTASQAPTRYRNHNGYLLRWDGRSILVDPGEGTQRQMLLAGCSPWSIRDICITHFHGDHCLGLPGVLQRLSLDGVPHPVNVLFPASGSEYFERLRHASVFHDRIEVRPLPVEGDGPALTDSTVTLQGGPPRPRPRDVRLEGRRAGRTPPAARPPGGSRDPGPGCRPAPAHRLDRDSRRTVHPRPGVGEASRPTGGFRHGHRRV